MNLRKIKDHVQAMAEFRKGKVVVLEKGDWHYFIYPGEDDAQYISMKKAKWGDAITAYYVEEK